MSEFESRISREEFAVEIVDGRPTITIGETHIHLDVHYVERDGSGFSTIHRNVDVEWDSDADTGPWWTIFRDFDKSYVEIDPSVSYKEDDTDE